MRWRRFYIATFLILTFPLLQLIWHYPYSYSIFFCINLITHNTIHYNTLTCVWTEDHFVKHKVNFIRHSHYNLILAHYNLPLHIRLSHAQYNLLLAHYNFSFSFTCTLDLRVQVWFWVGLGPRAALYIQCGSTTYLDAFYFWIRLKMCKFLQNWHLHTGKWMWKV